MTNFIMKTIDKECNEYQLFIETDTTIRGMDVYMWRYDKGKAWFTNKEIGYNIVIELDVGIHSKAFNCVDHETLLCSENKRDLIVLILEALKEYAYVFSNTHKRTFNFCLIHSLQNRVGTYSFTVKEHI